MADSGNMIFSNGNTLGYLVLNPIHKPTKEYINNITNEVYQLSVEVIDGKNMSVLVTDKFFLTIPINIKIYLLFPTQKIKSSY